MNPEVRTLWTEALRSGEYKQTQLQLKSNKGGYCCLGVLCELHSKQTNTPWDYLNRYLGSGAVIPLEVMYWAGLNDINPVIKHDDNICGPIAVRISSLNDNYDLPFPQLADLIEAQL